MIFYTFLSFIFFINLYDSLKFINFINRKLTNKVNMGCDYYIENNMYIYYNDNTCNYINLKRYREYYCEIYDDDLNFDSKKTDKLKKIKNYYLENRKNPSIIYTNNSFINISIMNSYKEMLDFEISNNDNKTWKDVKEIVILEERYEKTLFF